MTDAPTKRRQSRRGIGTIWRPKNSRFWWIAYSAGGKRHYESSESEKRGVAEKLLRSRLGDSDKGIAVNREVGKITVASALQHVIDDLTMNGRGTDNVQRRIDKHLKRTFATADTPECGYFHPDRKMATVTTADLTAYSAHRLAQKAAPASVNRELAIVRRAFRLAQRAGLLAAIPHVPMLQEDNVRTGFFERHEHEAIVAHLPESLRAPVRFAYLTGWRFKSEVLPLTVAQIDLTAGVVRLEPGTTKNRDGRTIHLTDALRTLLTAQLASVAALQTKGIITPYVFHYDDGSRIRDCRKPWKAACTAAGYPGKLFHDMRRSAVRTLERSGVPRSTAMAMVGHKTESIYRRYAIVDSAMLKEAAGKIDAYAAAQQATPPKKGQVRRFRRRA